MFLGSGEPVRNDGGVLGPRRGGASVGLVRDGAGGTAGALARQQQLVRGGRRQRRWQQPHPVAAAAADSAASAAAATADDNSNRLQGIFHVVR
jgi:hypothetical protein